MSAILSTRRVVVAGLLVFVAAAAPVRAAAAGPEKPRLVVLVTVDQLRGDLLERYAPALRGGFARVRREGTVFDGATVDHAPTNSYPGHVTIATGAHPRRHGIVDNSWAEETPEGWRAVGGVDDPAFPLVGATAVPEAAAASAPRGASPARLTTTGLADWFEAADASSVSVHVSTGEFAALLQSGKGKADGHSYWYSPGDGRFVTSRYYREDLPAFVERVNHAVLPAALSAPRWELTVPRRHRALALPDDAPGESFGVHGTFPHACATECAGAPSGDASETTPPAVWAYFTPLIDEVTIRLAGDAVRELRLGARGTTDYLNLALGGTDSVGHRYGPRSLEQLDTILRIDRALARLFRQLDRDVGRGRYVVAVVADHGSSEVPDASRRITAEMIESLFDELLALQGATPTPDEAALRDAAVRVVASKPYVARVFRHEELASADPADTIATLYGRAYDARKVPRYPLVSPAKGSLARFALVPVLGEGWVTPYAPANHGSPHAYDRHVTLMFMGPGIPAGRRAGGRTADVAPTLAALAGVRPLGEVDGVPLFPGRAAVAGLDARGAVPDR